MNGDRNIIRLARQRGADRELAERKRFGLAARDRDPLNPAIAVENQALAVVKPIGRLDGIRREIVILCEMPGA